MVEQLYNMTAGMRDEYVNPTADGTVSWRSICSSDTDSEEALQNWQEHNHELSSRWCANVKAVRWIGTELRDPPIYDGTGDVEDFLDQMEQRVAEDRLVPALDIALKATPIKKSKANLQEISSTGAKPK
jgi:hypothetical protein